VLAFREFALPGCHMPFEDPSISINSQNAQDCLDYLRQMRDAAAAFEISGGEQLRLPILESLMAAYNYLRLTLPPDEDRTTLRPILFLMQALFDLYRGNTDEALKAVKFSHRRPCSLATLQFKAECLITLEAMKHEGFPKSHVIDLVVRQYAPAAKKLGIDLSVKRLRSWERELRHSRSISDGRLTLLCHRYDRMFAILSKKWANASG
jgi:hypothetical protein